MFGNSSKSPLPAYCNSSPYKFLNNNNDSIISKNFTNSQSFKTLQETINENFKVVVRIRPPLPREIENGEFISTIQVSSDKKKLAIYEYFNLDMVEKEDIEEYIHDPNNYAVHQFSFDYVYDQDSTQEEVYENTAKQSVFNTLEGFNATIMAYGQTGTGKTYTMEGFKYNNHDPQRGIIPRSIEEIFKYIENCSDSKTTFMVRASYLQIYNEYISDLLRTERTNLHIREDKKKGVYVEGLSEWAVRTPNEIYSLIQKGAASRTTAATKMNDVSSRSHAIFIIIVEQMIQMDGQMGQSDVDMGRQIKVGKLNLVDLAGSERVRVTGATGKRLEECKKINQSLSALGNVIAALTDSKGNKNHIPYRDSKITRILEDSLGGNCKTTFMGMISAAVEAFGESVSSLKFANRAKNIRNAPIVNEDADHKALLRKYESELKKLKSELEEKNKILIDKTRFLQLEEDKKKAEQDKMSAVAALEARSKEFILEREEKKKLEEKILAMNSQLLIGGRKIEDTPQFRNALEEQQKIIREQYEQRLKDLEKERQIIEEDKAQVDKYKQLLVKQRDIMIALTGRLNERDETIIQLQEELDAYDRIHRETEEALENKNERVNLLESLLLERKITLPYNETKIKINNNDGDFKKDIVNYDGCETYNITKNNLLTSEQKIIQLSKFADNQKQEIQRLKHELESKNNEFGNYNSWENKFYEIEDVLKNERAIYNSNLKKFEENELELKEIVDLKNNEVEELKKMNKNSINNNQINTNIKQFINDQLSNGLEIKNSVDSIIETLSQPNEPQKLQNVAKELLKLQNLVDTSIVTIQKNVNPTNDKKPNNNNPFLNISNLVTTNNENQLHKNLYSNSANNHHPLIEKTGFNNRLKSNENNNFVQTRNSNFLDNNTFKMKK